MTTLTDGRALLRAIIDDPDDDLPRLAYADWLEENGQDQRAEFIRRQVAGDLGIGCDPKRAWPDSIATLAGKGEGAWERRWSRGFVEWVRCDLAEWLARGPLVVRAHPIQRVEIKDCEPDFSPSVGGTGGWLWMSSVRWDGRGDDESWLWLAYCEVVTARRKKNDPFRTIHDTRDDAVDAFSDACILWARKQEVAA